MDVAALITWQASGTTRNPDVHFPPSRCVHTTAETDSRPEPPVAKLARMSLPDIGLGLLFDDDKLTYLVPAAAQITKDLWSLTEAFTRFIMFKTLMNYNIVWPPDPNEANRWNEAPQSESVSFTLCRAVKKPFEDEQSKGWYPDFEPHQTVFTRKDMETYASVVNYELALAICYYLRGCDNAEYCLVEWYKALEVVRHYFGGEQKTKKALSPYGFDIAAFKKMTRYANDGRKPLSIGRHAPRKGAPLIQLDMRRMEHPMAEQVFGDAWGICRHVVEVFVSYLADQAGGK